MAEITKVTTEDVEKIRASAYKTKDRYEAEGYKDNGDMDVLIEFCDVLLGLHGDTVDGFLSAQDMEV